MPTRRDFLKTAAVAGAPLLGGAPALAATKKIRPEPVIRGGAFTLGVSAGQPRTDGAILWTRVDGIERSGRLTLEIARDADFRQVVVNRRVRASAVRDFTVRQNITGLPAGEEFFYRFHTKGADSPVGRLRTLRPPDSREPVRIGFFSCQKYSVGFYTAHQGLAAEPDLDLVVCLGDYIYESRVSGGARPDKTGVNGDGDVQSLADYQAKYQLYKRDEHLRAMHAMHPYVAIWDDHEAENDYAGTNPGTGSNRRVPFATRRRNGYEAFFQYHPVQRDQDDRSRIYRSIHLGGAEVFLMDQRQYRDALACEPLTPCPEGAAPGRSILGTRQRDWLVDGVSRSTAPWKVLASQVMFAGLDLAPGLAINADAWDGYADERRIIGERLLAAGVKDITTMTGDIHAFFAGSVTTTGRIDGRAFATEFVGGSITSEGINSELEGAGVPAGGGPLTPQALLAGNPHLRQADTVRNGYGVLEARPDELRVAFRTPASIATPNSTVRDLARFRVARGSTAVELV